MKKVAIGLTLLAVLGCVGYTSYSLVSFAKSKSEKAISSEKTESAKTAISENVTSTEKEVENSNEISPESTSNNAPSSSSQDGNNLYFPTEKTEMLNFESADAFILSYNALIEDVGGDVTREKEFSDINKAMLSYTYVGNITVVAYDFDGSLKEIIIKDKDVSDEVEKYLDGKAEVKYENGNTIISVLITNGY